MGIFLLDLALAKEAALSFIVEIHDHTISVYSPSHQSKKYGLIIKNFTLIDSIISIQRPGGAQPLDHIKSFGGQTVAYTLDFENKANRVDLIFLNPPLPKMPLKVGQSFYETISVQSRP